MFDKKEDPEDLTHMPSLSGEIHTHNTVAEDAVFGTITEDGPNYRNVHMPPAGRCINFMLTTT